MALGTAAENIQKNQPDAGMTDVTVEAVKGLESAAKVDQAAKLLMDFVAGYNKDVATSRTADITAAAENRRTQVEAVSKHNLVVNIIDHIDPNAGPIQDRATLEQSLNTAGPDLIGKDRKLETAVAALKEKMQKKYGGIMLLNTFTDPTGTPRPLTQDRIAFMRGELQPYIDKGFITQAEAEDVIRESAEAITKKAADIAKVYESGMLSETEALAQTAGYSPEVRTKLEKQLKEVIAKKPKIIGIIDEAKRNILLSRRTAAPLNPNTSMVAIYPNFAALSALEQQVIQAELVKEYNKMQAITGQSTEYSRTIAGIPGAHNTLAEAMEADLATMALPKGPLGEALKEAITQFNRIDKAKTITSNTEIRAKQTELSKEQAKANIVRLKHYAKWAVPAALLIGGGLGLHGGYSTLQIAIAGSLGAFAGGAGLWELNGFNRFRSLELDKQMAKEAKIQQEIEEFGMARATRMLESGMNARDVMTILISEGSSLKLDDVKNYMTDLTGFKDGAKSLLSILKPTAQTTTYASVA